ncbi:MAG: sulfatase-like hydrolase/transferase [Hyphomicrobiaceae bacterium]|nr:sulfatase-like hydrolase/transferase [Hyphomicrobiaceae bacterium]
MSYETSEQRRVYAVLSDPQEAAGKISPTLAYVLSALIATGLAYYHWFYEGWRENIIFAASITAALVAALTLISRRLLMSIATVAAVVAMIVVAADVKRRYIEMVLHAYDVVFYLTSWATIRFLWVDHRAYLIAIIVSFLLTTLLARMLYVWDSTRISRVLSGGLLVIFSCLAMWASYAKGERRNTLFYWDNLYLSSFYASWSETMETLMKGQLLEALKSQKKPLFTIPATCPMMEKPPHIVLIHQESVVPPSQFPQIAYDHSLDPFFRSFDGQLHNLRVETYGGASWLTEFSVLAGVSTYSFGGMRTFVQSLMQGKIHDTLPQALTRCGYHNSVFYPVPKDFVSNGRFYAAVGMPEIYDFKAQGAKRFNERDKFYYANLLSHLQKHVGEGPTFSFLITSATHLPYTYTYEPNETVPGGAPGTDPEMNEYLRRLAMAKKDYDAFRAQLKERFPNERFLIVQYGDHQPVATRTYLGFDKSFAAEDMKLDPDSPGFVTYYSVDGINYTPPPLPAVDTLEVPYLGTLLLEEAGLPLSPSYAERLRLLELCDGRYYTCANKREILSFHRRLMDSGLVEAR